MTDGFFVGGAGSPNWSLGYPTYDARYVKKTGDTMTGALAIDGSTDAIQLQVKAHNTQTNPIVNVENSIGASLVTVKNDGALGVGTNYTISGAKAIGIGTTPTASNEGSIAIGSQVTAAGRFSCAIGYAVIANNTYATTIGAVASASGTSSTAVGAVASASGTSSTAIGYRSFAEGNGSVAISAYYAMARSDSTYAIGYQNQATNTRAGVLGSGIPAGPFLSNGVADSLLLGVYAVRSHWMYPTSQVFNEDGIDYDLRIEGDTDTNLLFIDASADSVGIGTNAPTAKLDINSDILRLRTAKTPANAGAAGNAGDFCWDANYFYICIAANTWQRAAHATW